MSARRKTCSVGLVLGALLLPACVLAGIEPDEIDVAVDESGGLGESGGAEDDGLEGTEGGNTTGDAGGDGDGDTTGDGDTGGDGDGDTAADTTGDGDTGDTTTGGPNESCDPFGAQPVEPNETEVEILDGESLLAGSCGGAGPESVYSFVAPEAGDYEFEVDSAEFEAVVYLVSSCEPFEEAACATGPASVVHALAVGQEVFVVVDSDTGPGAGVLTITAL